MEGLNPAADAVAGRETSIKSSVEPSNEMSLPLYVCYVCSERIDRCLVAIPAMESDKENNTPDDSKRGLVCTGWCQRSFHASCYFLHPKNGSDLQLKDHTWMCAQCQLWKKKNRGKVEEDLNNRVLPMYLGGPNSIMEMLQRGLEFVDAAHAKNVVAYRSLAEFLLRRVHDIAKAAPEPLKTFAYLKVDLLAQRILEDMTLNPSTEITTVPELMNSIKILFSLQRIGFQHNLGRLIQSVYDKNFTRRDLLGYDPLVEDPTTALPRPCGSCGKRNNAVNKATCSNCGSSVHYPTTSVRFVTALMLVCFAERVGLQLGCTCADLFRHIPKLRLGYARFASNAQYDANQYMDYLLSIYAILEVASRFGTLKLSSALFQVEYDFILQKAFLEQILLNRDHSTLSQLVYCMALFGLTQDTSEAMKSCLSVIIAGQDLHGGWMSTSSSVDRALVTTILACRAACAPSFEGFGPRDLRVKHLLQGWQHLTSFESCGVNVQIPHNQSGLRSLYTRNRGKEMNENVLVSCTSSRLMELAKMKSGNSFSETRRMLGRGWTNEPSGVSSRRRNSMEIQAKEEEEEEETDVDHKKDHQKDDVDNDEADDNDEIVSQDMSSGEMMMDLENEEVEEENEDNEEENEEEEEESKNVDAKMKGKDYHEEDEEDEEEDEEEMDVDALGRVHEEGDVAAGGQTMLLADGNWNSTSTTQVLLQEQQHDVEMEALPSQEASPAFPL